MQIVHEIDVLEQVRALSEHRAPKRVLLTVPYVAEYRAPRARVSTLPPEALMKSPAEETRRRVVSRISLNDALELFRQTNPGEFTTRECAEFMMAAGYAALNILPNIVAKLRKEYFANRVLEVRRERAGKANLIIWRFAP